MSIPYRGRNLPTKTQGAQGRLSSILKFDISGYTETEGFFRAARRESVPRDVAFHCRGPRRLRHLRFEYHRWDSDKLFATSTSCCSSFSISGSSTSRTSPNGSTQLRGRLLAHLPALWLGVARRRAILGAKHTVGWQERSGLPCHASAKGMGPAILLCDDGSVATSPEGAESKEPKGERTECRVA